MRYGSLVLWLLIAVPCGSQTTTGTAETKGPCSPAVTSSNNQITITCTGISDKLGAQLVDLLNRVAKNQVDAQAMMAKLDSCIEGVKPWRLTEDQKTQLKQSVQGIQAKVWVRYLSSSENAALMAWDIYPVLKDAGLNLNPGAIKEPIAVTGPQFDGINLLTSHLDFPDAALLETSLNVVIGPKVVIRYCGVPDLPDDTISLIVGNKPQPPSPR